MQDSEISERIEFLYGAVDWRNSTGILHVAAIAGEPPRAIAIGPSSPASVTDRFVLGFARARADVIVTTGAILRAEPELIHCYAEDEKANAAFARWRGRVLGTSGPPALVLLSASGAFPLDHPALAAAERGLVWTTSEGHARLGRSRVARLAVEAPKERGESLAASVLSAIERARSVLQARTVLIEAGPTTSSTLYPGLDELDEGGGDGGVASATETCRIDELLLSRFAGKLEEAAVGPPFIAEARITARFGRPVSAQESEEASGPWRFERYRADA